MTREHREFRWTNEDGEEGLVKVRWGPWDFDPTLAAPVMVSYEEGQTWMSAEDAQRFAAWLPVQLAEAREHPGADRVSERSST